MKAKNSTEFLGLFDYAKIAFGLNKSHRSLYKPQIVFLILRGILLLLTFLTLTNLVVQVIEVQASFYQSLHFFWELMKGLPLLILVATLLVTWFGSAYVEAGLIALYIGAYEGTFDQVDFWDNANRHFLWFILGDFLVLLVWIIGLIPFFLVGLLTLTLGFIWVPIIVSTFLMTWKVALISDQAGIMNAFKSSFSLAKNHFFPMIGYTVLKNAIMNLGAGSGGGGGSANSNINLPSNLNNNDTVFNGFNTPSEFGTPDMMNSLHVIEYVLYAVIGLITVISIIAGLIKMIFHIFFGLMTVVIYRDKFRSFNIEESIVDQATDLGGDIHVNI